MTDYRQPDEREHVPNETVPSGPLPLAVAPSSVAWFAAAQHLRMGAVKLRKTGHTCAARDNLKTAKLCDEIARLLKNDNL